MERRAYYNALRMNQYRDPSILVEDWQVCDYRKLSQQMLFSMMSEWDLYLDRTTFLSFAKESETPEELTDHLIGEAQLDETTIDRIYLILFELWRRFLPEKRCLSIFCDEIDYQIFTYNAQQIENSEPLENSIANLKQVLEDNEDLGEEPAELFSTIADNCANDLETFLYDFIAERIDLKNFSYAEELIEDFEEVVQDSKWFAILKARLLAEKDPSEAQDLIVSLVKKTASEKDLEFNFEMLFFLVHEGDQNLFLKAAKNTFSLLESEQDFQDLLQVCADYYQFLDKEDQEREILQILDDRKHISLQNSMDSSDPDLKKLRKILRVPND